MRRLEKSRKNSHYLFPILVVLTHDDFSMAAIRTFLKRTVVQHSSNLSPGTNTDSSSDTSSSTTSERRNIRATDGFNNASPLSVLIINNTNTNNHDDETLRHPLLHLPPTNRHRKFFSCLVNSSTMNNTQIEQLLDENISLLDKKLPKEVLLRIFSFLDYQSLCRCAQVSKVNSPINLIFYLIGYFFQYWNTLALDGSNWQTINLKTFQRDINGTVLESLSFRCGKFLKKLNIENCKCITDQNMRFFFSMNFFHNFDFFFFLS